MPPKKIKTVKASSINRLKKYATMPIIFAYIVSIVLIYNTYGYLTELENCHCFDKSKVDIKFLKYYELATGILGTCVVLLNIFIYLYPSNKKVGGGPVMESLKANGGLRLSNIIILSVLLFLHFLIASNAYNLYHNIENDCECSNQWEQYYVYLQGTGSSIYIGSFILRVLLVLSILFML
tara:strand:- start:271 stop:810 length:540 start_codon:yes stop_codon:yes gene_type:complete